MIAPTKPDPRDIYGHFHRPVCLVTTLRGLERYDSSYRLFDRLEQFAAAYESAGYPRAHVIMAIWRGYEHVTEDGVAALEEMLRTTGFGPFCKATRDRTGPERVFRTKWSWDFLGEYLGWEWRRGQ